MKPVVAIVGRPNVGKSSLFNRIAGGRRSIVADTAGVTRDRIYAETELSVGATDRAVVLVDTGGYDPDARDPIFERVLDQTQLAIDEADVICFVVDGRAGVHPRDFEVAARLRRGDKPVAVAVNKIDGAKQDVLVAEFHELGLAEVIPISAAHGRNVGMLTDWLALHLPPGPASELPAACPLDAEGAELDDAAPEVFGVGAGADADADADAPMEADAATAADAAMDAAAPDPEAPVRVSVIGRPNAGKSSLINRLLGEDRHLVSEVAGTTMDAVDSLIEVAGQRFLFIDTAGIRRKRSIALRIEQYSVMAALKGIDRSDVAVLLLDASTSVAQQDARVAAFAHNKGKAVVLVASKSDLVPTREARQAFRDEVRRELRYLNYAPLHFVSAATGDGMPELLQAVQRVHREYARRIPTGELNRFIGDLMDQKPPSSRKGRRARIYYMSQVSTRPPRFVASVNEPSLIHFSYERFLVNALRRAYNFQGVPVSISFRAHDRDRAPPGGFKRREKGALDVARDPRKQATAVRRARKAAKRGQRKKAGPGADGTPFV